MYLEKLNLLYRESLDCMNSITIKPFSKFGRIFVENWIKSLFPYWSNFSNTKIPLYFKIGTIQGFVRTVYILLFWFTKCKQCRHCPHYARAVFSVVTYCIVTQFASSKIIIKILQWKHDNLVSTLLCMIRDHSNIT